MGLPSSRGRVTVRLGRPWTCTPNGTRRQGYPSGQSFALTRIPICVAVGADGITIVTWTSDGPPGETLDLYAQRYTASGLPLGTEFRVNTYSDLRSRRRGWDYHRHVDE